MININNDKCIGCGMCQTVCPRDVIRIMAKKAGVKDPVSCLECGACSLNCPVGAIEVTKGTGCLVAILKEDILKTVPKGTGCCGNNKKGCC